MPLPLLCCLIGLTFSVIMAMIGGLLSRSIGQIDKKLDSQGQKLDDNCAATQTIHSDLQGYKLLVNYLRDEVKDQKHENSVLREAHHATDKRIAIVQALHPAAFPKN